jgi:hypothetical protein
MRALLCAAAAGACAAVAVVAAALPWVCASFYHLGAIGT